VQLAIVETDRKLVKTFKDIPVGHLFEFLGSGNIYLKCNGNSAFHFASYKIMKVCCDESIIPYDGRMEVWKSKK